jgi:AGZA family xanthine/uracil permease-like MFS transporter
MSGIFRKSDLNGFFALFADNLANMVILSGVCIHLFKIDPDIVFGRIIPGLGISLLFGLGYYAWAAIELGKRENRNDVTALPYGISTPVMFIYLFGVMAPIYFSTNNGILAWQIGLAACFIGGIIEALGSVIGPYLKSVTPRAGMLGTLAGIALVYIAMVPLAMIFESPLIGFPSLIIIFIGLIAAIRLPFGIPAGLLAILTGSILGIAAGATKISAANISFHLPIPVISDLLNGLHSLISHPELISVIIPIEIYNFIETMNNVESAEAAGDKFEVRSCQIVDGLGTMLGALFGSCFPTTVYIGHPAYKRLGGGVGYALMVGIVFALGSLFGMVGFLHDLIPHVAVAPLLVFVGIVIVSQAFSSSPKSHAPAVAVALIPHVASIVYLQVTGAARTIQDFYSSSKVLIELNPNVSSTLNSVRATLSSSMNSLLLNKEGIHLHGEELLSQGAIITGLIWGGITAFLIDGEFKKAGTFSIFAAILNFIGVIHSSKISIQITQIFWGYIAMGIIFFIIDIIKLEKDSTIKEF